MSPTSKKLSKKQSPSSKQQRAANEKTAAKESAAAKQSAPLEEVPSSSAAAPPPVTRSRLLRALRAGCLAWLVPGAGHLWLGRRGRAAVFFGLVVTALAVGCWLQGGLPWTWSGSPLQVLRSLGALGSGVLIILLRFAVGYEGDISVDGFDYGSAFLVTAGLMNYLLVLDAWDIALGRKE